MDSRTSRRRLLSIFGSGLLGTVAGCSTSTGSEQSETTSVSKREKWRKDKNELIKRQTISIPPIKELYPYLGPSNTDGPHAGIASVMWDETDRFHPEYTQIPDEFTIELFSYGKYPVENDIDLVKIAEKTTHLGVWREDIWDENGELLESELPPYPANEPSSNHVFLKYDSSKIPRNQQVRFRVRITNNRTGKQGWAWDESLGYFLQYNGDLEFFYDSSGHTIKDGDPYQYDGYGQMNRILEKTEDSYKFIHRIQTDFPSSIHEELPYSAEAETVPANEDEMWIDYQYNFPHDTIHQGEIVDIPKDGVELARNWYDKIDAWDLNALQFRRSIPSQYEYAGQDVYDVLDNPLLHTFAENINTAMDDYGVDNHYARIQSAIRLIQGSDYSTELGANFQLPEQYFASTKPGDCSSHTQNLIYLLYHLGYPVGKVLLQRSGVGHTAPAIGVPEEVIREEFPLYLKKLLFKINAPEYDSPITSKGKNDNYGEQDLHPEKLGDLTWIYIESASTFPIRERLGANPMGQTTIEYEDLSIEMVYEPEDPWFDTGIENTLPKR